MLQFYKNKTHINTKYLLAKIGVDTAENGPLKVCQRLAKRQRKKVSRNQGSRASGTSGPTPPRRIVAESGRPGRAELLAKKGRIVGGVGCPPNCRTSGKLRGNFGEAPTLSNFLEKCCILEKSRNILAKIQQNSGKFCEILGEKNSKKFSNF